MSLCLLTFCGWSRERDLHAVDHPFRPGLLARRLDEAFERVPEGLHGCVDDRFPLEGWPFSCTNGAIHVTHDFRECRSLRCTQPHVVDDRWMTVLRCAELTA